MVFFLAGGAPIVLWAGMTVIEALMFFQLRWAKLGGSFRDALAVNLGSAVVLVLLWQLLSMMTNIFLLLGAACVISIIVEGFILILLRKRTSSQSYLAALVSNVTSYIFVLAYVLTFLIG
jgi:hypothetical protein